VCARLTGPRPVGGSWLRLAALAPALLLCSLTTLLPAHSALAQQPADPAAETEAEPQRSGAARVLFVLPELDADADAQLRDALLAQFTLVEAELSFAAPRAMGRTQLERLSALHALAQRSGALAAFFLDVEPSGRWLLHVFDAERERLVLRPLDGSGAQRQAAIEAVAVMTRESTRALLEGQPVPVPSEPAPAEPAQAAPPTPTAAPPATQAAPAPSAPARSWLRPRLSLGYVATTFGDASALRHGAALSVGQRLSDRTRVALGVDLTPALQYAASPPFEVQTIPVRGGLAGRVAEAGTLALELEGVLTVEWLLRHSRAAPAAAPSADAVDPKADAIDIVVATGLRAHGELRLGAAWALWLAFGSDVLLNPFSYVANKDGAHEELLSLYRVRLLAQLGLAVDL
jgi:hypothetical protein